MATRIDSIKVYWDTQGSEEVWGYRFYTKDNGELREFEGGGLDEYEADHDPRDIVVDLAWGHDIEITSDMCAYEPRVDGGWAEWTRG